jgi:zinc protease
VRFGFDDGYFAALPGKVAALTQKDLADAARMLDPDRLVWVVVGDRAKVEAGLRELGMGDVRVIDAEGNEVKAPVAAR